MQVVANLEPLADSPTIRINLSKKLLGIELNRERRRRISKSQLTLRKDGPKRLDGSFSHKNNNDLHRSTFTRLHTLDYQKDTSLSQNSKTRRRKREARGSGELSSQVEILNEGPSASQAIGHEKDKYAIKDGRLKTFTSELHVDNQLMTRPPTKMVDSTNYSSSSESFLDVAEDFVDGAVSTAIHFLEDFTNFGNVFLTNAQSLVNYFANATVTAVNKTFLNYKPHEKNNTSTQHNNSNVNVSRIV